MKVECIASTGSHLSAYYYSIGYTRETIFDTTVGSTYVVYSICFWRKILMYLICDDYSLPNWYPAEVFRVVERNLPANWIFMYMDGDAHTDAIWAYPEMIEQEEHYVALIERDRNALRIFEKAKLEIDSDFSTLT